LAQVTDAVKSRGTRGIRVIPLVVLACWLVGVFVFAALPGGSGIRNLVADGLYYGAAAFVSLALARAIVESRGRQRLFWALLGAGAACLFAGNLGYLALQQGVLGEEAAAYRHAAYLVSYLLLAGAMLVLVDVTTRRITLITALDAVGIMTSTGILTMYFFPASSSSGLAMLAFAWLTFDAALLFLCLVVMSAAGRPPFVGALAAAFLVLGAGDGLHLAARASSAPGGAGWTDVLWALGLILLGFAALGAAPFAAGARARIEPWRVFVFWFGPLSPAVHLSVVLFWGAMYPPIPSFVAAGGAALFLYLGLRVALVSFVSRRLSDEQEALARKLEGGRVLSEMHDTVKQGVHGISLTLRAALDASRRGEQDETSEMVSNALRSARETEFQVSRPYEELQTSIHGEGGMRPRNYLRHRLVKFEEYFGIKTHEDLQAPLESLPPMEVAAIYRFVIEAFWNVAKHSDADNMHLESRRVGDLMLVRVRDDGRGFDPENPPPGLGLDYMRGRAREVGAEFDAISAPGRGTTVQLRFRAPEA
jgi:signal transduction histidine kinase